VDNEENGANDDEEQREGEEVDEEEGPLESSRPTRSDPRSEPQAKRKRTMPNLPRTRLSTKKDLKPWTRKQFKTEVRRNEFYISESKRK
jgi:hypothetical protein